MEKSAIQQIQESGNIPALVQQFDKVPASLAALPNSMELHSLETYMATANRLRFKFARNSIFDFTQYHEDHDTEYSACFVNKDSMSAKTIFDLGDEKTPLHKDHQAALVLEKTAVFKAICSVDGEKLNQKTISDFIEDWADSIDSIVSKQGESIQPIQAAASLRNLTIETAREVNSQVEDFGSSLSAMERIEAKNQDALPSVITFKSIPYHGLSERDLKLRLSVLTSSEKPVIVIRMVQGEAIMEDIANEFKTIISKELDVVGLPVYMGSAQ